jgi:glycerol-3-phosphate dehydrogenase
MWARISKTQKLLVLGGTTTTALYLYINHQKQPFTVFRTRNHIVYAEQQQQQQDRKLPVWHAPKREAELNKLRTTPEFDLLIVGGGATGTGVAVDAVTRGLNVAVVERDDFAAGKIEKKKKTEIPYHMKPLD